MNPFPPANHNVQLARRTSARAGHAAARWQLRALVLPLLIVLVGGVTFGLRAFNLSRSYDIFIDEVTYLRIGLGIAETMQVKLYGKTFHLHPPAFFFVEAAYVRLLAVSGTLIEQIYAVRYLNLGFAGLSAIFLFLIGRRVAGTAAGLVAALLFALDAFIIKMNSFIMLDTSAVFWVLAGYWLIIAALDETPAPQPLWQTLAASRLLAILSQRRLARLLWRGGAALGTLAARLLIGKRPGPPISAPQPGQQLSLRRCFAVGLLFGLGLLTKDMTAFLSLLPLGICFVLGWPLARRSAVLIGEITCLTYAAYPITTALVGDWDRFAQQKLSGFERFTGASKVTGVNRHGGPSLLEVVIGRLDQFATTYLLIGLGTLAVVILLLRGGAAARMLAFWTASAYALLAYCILFGTLEEQFFYFLVLPSLLATACAGTILFNDGRAARRSARLPRAIPVLLALFVAWSGAQWYIAHTTPDNGYQQVLSFLQQHVPAGSDVAATSETAQFLLDDYKSAPFGSWHTLEELRAAEPEYLVVTPHTLAWNHGDEAAPLLSWINRQGEPIFTFRGKGDNLVMLYHFPDDVWQTP